MKRVAAALLAVAAMAAAAVVPSTAAMPSNLQSTTSRVVSDVHGDPAAAPTPPGGILNW